MFKRFILLLFSFFIFLASIHSQHGPVFYQDVGVLEEYTNPQITSLYQDFRGLLWISTYGGMDRWDGKRMVHYPYLPFDSIGSPSRIPGGFTGDGQNNIWLLGDGLIRFDLEIEVFHSVPLCYDGADLVIRYIKYDPKGFLWVGAMDGIYQYYPETDSLHQIPVLGIDEIKKSGFRMVSILQDSTGNIWMSHNQYGLCWFDQERRAFRVQSMDLPDFVDKQMNVGTMKEDPEGNFWLFGRKAELASFNPYTREFQWAGLPVYGSVAPSSWGGLAIDYQGMIWFGVDRGLMLYDPVTKKLTHMDTPKSLAYVIDMITDNHGNIIVGTLEGVKVIDPRENNYRTIDVHLDRLIEGVGWHTCVVRDEDILWMGTFRAGLIRYNMETGQHVNYQADGKPGSIKSNYVTKILRDRSGRIWFTAGWDGSLYRVNPDRDSFEHFLVGKSHFITQGEEGFFWVLGRDHILRFDPITLDTTQIHFKEPLPVENLDSQLDFVPFIQDDEGIFWFAQGDGGLYRINPESRKWTHYNYDKNNPDGLPDQHVKSLFCDSRGSIWLSTWVGLSRVIKNPVDDTAISFDNHYITDFKMGHTSRITEDDFGNIFVGNLYGVMVIRNDGTLETYSKQDGLLVDPSRTWMVERDHENGTIYLGGHKMMIIHPYFLSPDASIVSTVFTEFRIGGLPVVPGKASPLKSSILVTDRINLRYDQNFFRIDFAATHLSHPEKNRYRYFMEGIDIDTIYSGNQSFAEYTNLKPGHYTFWVSSAIHRGPWNPQGSSIEIRIRPPWYMTQLALAIYFVLIITLILGIIQMRTARLLREKLYLEAEVQNRTDELVQKNRQIVEMEQLKTRFFTNISHEFRTLLTLIKGPVEDVLEDPKTSRRNRGSLDVVRRNTYRLMTLVNQLLDISKLDKGDMKLILMEENIFDFTHAIAVSFSSLAESKGIQYRFHIPTTDSRVWFDPEKLEKIIFNLLSNAFKFTEEGGKVVLKADHLTGSNGQENVLEISVSDTGYGIPSEEQHKIFDRFYQAEAHLRKEGGGTGIGLALTSDLVQLMHGTISVKSKPGKGSKFHIRIPLGKAHLKEDEYKNGEIRKETIKSAYDRASDIETIGDQPAIEDHPGIQDGHRPLLLVVEDNADIRMMMVDNLEPEFQVIEAVDGSAGLKLATDQIPDLIITDLMMPRMDGFEMCSQIKSDIRSSHIPIIMLTAKATLEDKLKGLETGADDYIPKPFDIKEVIVRARNLIEQRKKLREKFSNRITLDPHDVVITSVDEQFLQNAIGTVETHMGEETFDVSMLCKEMNMSRSTLFRKLEALTNLSPVEFIRAIRMKRAATLLKQHYGNVSEVALEVGFNNPSYFTRVFRKSYKVSPSKYAKLQD
ncbi:MAG: hypothetical protein DRI98_06710 [Bacteroidetes bacterium]|nr:MAG: hypothetical protein DRI98_06710 [Bacteroidota bacterium]